MARFIEVTNYSARSEKFLINVDKIISVAYWGENFTSIYTSMNPEHRFQIKETYEFVCEEIERLKPGPLLQQVASRSPRFIDEVE